MQPSLWTLIRRTGLGGVEVLGLGTVGVLLGVAGLVMLAFSRKVVAHRLGLASVLLALGAALAGLLGVSAMDREMEQALATSGFGKIQKERLRLEAEPGARGLATLGYATAMLPLLLGGIAAFLGARKRPGESPGHLKMALTGVAVVATLTACGAARATSQREPSSPHHLPPWDPGWRLLEAQEHAAVNIDQGCVEMESVLQETYWVPTKRPTEAEMAAAWAHPNAAIAEEADADDVKKRFPRVFQPDPHVAMPDFDTFANKCVRRWVEVRKADPERQDVRESPFRDRTLGDLLESPLLVDKGLFDEVRDAVQKSGAENGTDTEGMIGADPGESTRQAAPSHGRSLHHR